MISRDSSVSIVSENIDMNTWMGQYQGNHLFVSGRNGIVENSPGSEALCVDEDLSMGKELLNSLQTRVFSSNIQSSVACRMLTADVGVRYQSQYRHLPLILKCNVQR